MYEHDGTFDWAMRRDASCVCSDAVGTWDESFFLYSEETDFALRAAERDFTLRFVAESRACIAAAKETSHHDCSRCSP